jgi:hypothetical protein
MANETLTEAVPRTGTFEANPRGNTRKRAVHSSRVTGSAADAGTETSMIQVHRPR